MNQPVFSIVMPAYNAELTIEESILSVLSQSYTDFELLISNDFSQDNTDLIIRKYSRLDSRIIIIDHKKNNGVAEARNSAISRARGKYIAFLDADDIWMPEKLEQQYILLEEGWEIVYSTYIRFYPNGKEIIVTPPSFAHFSSLLKGNYIGNLTGVYNCKKLGKLYQRSIGHEDYLMWLELLKKSNLAISINKPLAKYRVTKDSLSSNKIKNIRWMWNIYRDHLNLNIFSSFSNLIAYTLNALKKRI